MRLAWFSPFPPERSGIATYSAEIVPLLSSVHDVDRIPESGAHDFVWRHRRDPYDLVVYQLGNAPCHDYMWAYLTAFPGLVVLHDARLHHARARRLLKDRRYDDYRRELAYDHPDARTEVAEYAVEGLSGSIYYFWSMLRVVMQTARLVAVHNPRVAGDLQSEYPGTALETIAMGVSPIAADPAARRLVRHALEIPDDAIVFAAFGRVTPEKRIPAILEALALLRREGLNAWLLIVGEGDDRPGIVAAGVRATGYVSDAAVGAYLTGRGRLPVPPMADGARNIGVVAAVSGGRPPHGDHRPSAPGGRPAAGRAARRSAERARGSVERDAASGVRSRSAQRTWSRRPGVLGVESHASGDGPRLRACPHRGCSAHRARTDRAADACHRRSQRARPDDRGAARCGRRCPETA
jgi:hypothetical protein